MQQERLHEIGFLLFKRTAKERGVPGKDFQKEINSAAKDIGIKPDELTEFYREILPGIVENILERPKQKGRFGFGGAA